MNFFYSRIALGLTLELIDIRIMNFDLLPDIIGYLLIMWGAYRLSADNRAFMVAWAAAAIQLLPSCAALFGYPISFPLLGSESLTAVQLIKVALTIIPETVMLFGICAGIRASALRRGLPELAASSQSRWNFVIVIDGLILFLMPFLLNVAKEDWFYLILLLGIAAFIAHFCVIFLVKRAGREGHGDDGEESRIPVSGKRLSDDGADEAVG